MKRTRAANPPSKKNDAAHRLVTAPLLINMSINATRDEEGLKCRSSAIQKPMQTGSGLRIAIVLTIE